MIVDQAFRIGDWIETPTVGNGIVEEVSLSTIKIRKFSKAVQTVPNGVMAAEPITNWSRMSNRRIKMDIGLTYDTTSEQLEAILVNLRAFIGADDRVDHSVAEMVHMTQFSVSSIDINLYYFTITTNWEEWRAIQEEHMLAFMGILEEAGASMAFPTRTVHVQGWPDGLQMTEG